MNTSSSFGPSIKKAAQVSPSRMQKMQKPIHSILSSFVVNNNVGLSNKLIDNGIALPIHQLPTAFAVKIFVTFQRHTYFKLVQNALI